MRKQERVNGYTFNLDDDQEMYECRGEVCYDDEHDEVPDPKLWEATNKLADMLERKGINASAQYSEKGWQEVIIGAK